MNRPKIVKGAALVSGRFLAGIFSLALTPCFLFLSGCGSEQGGGRKSLILIPDSQMNKLGAESYQEIKDKTPESVDSALKAKVVEVGKAIAKASEADFEWEFALFHSDEINAFCLPGGKIGVFTGILPYADNTAGLAAIMGHEVAHATMRHGAQRLSSGLVAELGFAAIAISLDDSPYRDEIMGALGLGYQVGVALPFSRDHESEADRMGLTYLARAGYDPSEAARLWERMAKIGSSTPDFLSTHPDPKTRAESLRKWEAEVAEIYSQSAKKSTLKL
jgi:predicted Zn-dependent protease